MIKVCHMTSVHNSQDVRILKKQCVSLAKTGYETYLVARGDSYIESNVNVIGVGYDKVTRFKRIFFITRKIYKEAVKLNCDIYQIHDPELLPFALKLKRKGKKVIFDSHEDYKLQIIQKKYLPKYFKNIISIAYSNLETYILKRIDAVIFPALLNGKNIFKDRCKYSEIIGNQPLLEEFYDKYTYKEKLKKNIVCYTGSLSYDRGIENIIDASYISKTKLILSGKFNNKDFENNIVSKPEFKNIDYLGVCDRKQILEIYEKSNIGICTLLNRGQYNIYDNFATKVYEYMSMGLPVIISDYNYAREINKRYNFCILVNPDNIEEISQAINYLVLNPDVAKQMGINGRKAVKTQFNWEIEEKKLIKLYEKVIGEL